MQAYRETVNWLFAAMKRCAEEVYADWLNISIAKAKRSRDDFYPWAAALDPDTRSPASMPSWKTR